MLNLQVHGNIGRGCPKRRDSQLRGGHERITYGRRDGEKYNCVVHDDKCRSSTGFDVEEVDGLVDMLCCD